MEGYLAAVAGTATYLAAGFTGGLVHVIANYSPANTL
jgi:hypothetical protein